MSITLDPTLFTREFDIQILGAIAQSQNRILFLLDAEGNVVSSVGGGLEGIGFKQEELRNRNYYELYENYPIVGEMTRKVLQDGQIGQFSGWFHARYLQVELYPMRDGKRIIGAAGFVVDKTDQEKAQQEIYDQKVMLDGLFEGVRDGMLIIDRDLKIVRENEAMSKLFPLTNHSQSYCYSKFRAKEEPCLDCPVRQTFADGKKHSRIDFFPENNKWVELSSFPFRDSVTGEITRVIEFVRDVSNQQIEKITTERREKLLAGILNSSHDGIIALSDAEGVSHFNPRLKELFYDDGDIHLGSSEKDIYNLVVKYGHNPQEIYEARSILRNTNQPQKGTMYLKDGRVFEWSAVSVDLGDVPAEHVTRFWTFHDATELYHAAEAIRQDEIKYRNLFNTMPSGLSLHETVLDEQGEVVDFLYADINPALEKIISRPREEIVGKTVRQLYSQIRVVAGEREGNGLVDIGKAAIDGKTETHLTRNPVSGKYLNMTAFRTVGDQIGMFVSDETDRIRSERALRESEERLRSLFTSLTNGVIILDAVRDENGKPVDYVVSSCNPAYAYEFNTTPEEMIGRSLIESVAELKMLSHDFGDQWWTCMDLALEGHADTYQVVTHYKKKPLYEEVVVFPCGEDKVGLLSYDVTRRVESEREIHENEERLRRMFTSMTNGLILLDVIRDEEGKQADYIISHVNPAFAAVLKSEPEKLEGRSFLDLLNNVKVTSHNFGERWWAGIETAADGLSDTYHVHVEEFQPLPYKEVVVFSSQENQVGILMYDETFRILSEQRLRTMRFIIDHISEPVFWLFLDGTIQYVNAAAATALGFEGPGITPDGPIAEKVWIFDTSVTSDNWNSILKHFEEEKTMRFETVFVRKDGTRFPALVVVDMLKQGTEPFLAACFHDMSEQIRRIEAEQAMLAKSKFLDHMSHEIRTPLNGVIGIMEILLGMELESKQREYVELAKTSGRHLLSLVNNILDYSKLEHREIKLEHAEFDLPELIESVLGVLAAPAFERKLALCGLFLTDVPRHVVGDAGRLRQILVNLIGNGLKFTESGGVKLTVSVVSQGRISDKIYCTLLFEVIDTGIGISEEQMVDLFQSFTLGDVSFARQHGGTGLGLVIAKELVELMNGELDVESRVDSGSTFRFTVRLETKEAELAVQNIFRHGRLEMADQSVIVVEENEVLLDTLVQLFESWGMSAHAYKRKTEAVTALLEAADQKRPYRIAVIDYCLEDAPGKELIGTIKEHPDLKETSIIMLTSVAEDFSKTGTTIHAADRFVSKPIFGSTLFNAVLGIMTGTEDQPDDPDLTPPPFFPSASEETEVDRPLILVVEDNRINQIVVGEILSQAGFRFEMVEDGTKACDAVVTRQFDLILMDCQMPVMDGFEATRQIRQMEAGENVRKPAHAGHIPIVALTANALQGDEQQCHDAGMDGFFSKPVNAAKLIETLKRWIKLPKTGFQES